MSTCILLVHTEIPCNPSELSLVLLLTLKCFHKYPLEIPGISGIEIPLDIPGRQQEVVYLKAAENPLHPEEQN